MSAISRPLARLAAFLALSLVAVLTSALAQAQPLVDSAWLKANMTRPDIVIIDVTSGGGRTKDDFAKGHIPGSVFTDYAKDGWRIKTKDDVEGQLPPASDLEKVIGGFGVSNDTHVIFVPLGLKAIDMGAATRLYWTMKVMGHDRVSILDGGLADWAKIDPATKRPVNPIETGAGRTPARATFVAHVRRDMLVDAEDVKKAIANNVSLVDNRPNDFYVGLSVSPAAKSPGTIPGAKNVQEGFLTVNNGGRFRNKAQLDAIYKSLGVPTEGDQITFCNTGHWASVGWFASHELLGNTKAKLYGGSMSDWTRQPGVTIERKIPAP